MQERWEIILPWPNKALSPNARGHWAKKNRIARGYRHTCAIKSLQYIRENGWKPSELRQLLDYGGQIHVFLDFYPPDRRERDDDNVAASFKSGRDGLADALKVDDCHFRTHPFLHRDKPCKGGCVRVVITGKGPEAEGAS